MVRKLVLDVSKFNFLDDAACLYIKRLINNESELAFSDDSSDDTEYSGGGIVIKLGYRGANSSGSLLLDDKFIEYYDKFASDCKVGVYWTTNAISRNEAEAEARFIANALVDRPINFPIFIESKYANQEHTGRADGLSSADRIAYINKLALLLRDLYHFRVGILADEDFYINNLSGNNFQYHGFPIWISKTETADPPICVTNYTGWRFTNNGMINNYVADINLSWFYYDVAGWEHDPNKTDIGIYKLDLSFYTHKYTGDPIEPVCTLGEGLVEDRDFEISYSDNVNVGICTVTATAISTDYYGTSTAKFEITKTDITTLPITLEYNSIEYTGTPFEPIVTINNLVKDVDFTVRYENNTNVGTANVYIDGIGNYYNEAIEHFDITSSDIRDINITFKDGDEYSYTGDPIEPELVFSYPLVEDVDYTLSYENNISITTGGTPAKVIITGIGNYSGHSVVLEFEITGINIADYDDKVIWNYRHYVYNGKPYTPPISIRGLDPDTDYSVEYRNNINASSSGYRGTVIVHGEHNYYGEIGRYFDIMPASITAYRIYVPGGLDYNYTGEPIEPSIVVGDLILDQDYIVEYRDNVNVGVGNIIVYGINNYTGMISQSFSIVSELIIDPDYPEGRRVDLDKIAVFATYDAIEPSDYKEGTYYVYKPAVYNGRIRLCRSEDATSDDPNRSAGWFSLDDLKNSGKYKIGDIVNVTGNLYQLPNALSNFVIKHHEDMYIVEILPTSNMYPYGLASAPNLKPQGYANPSIFDLPYAPTVDGGGDIVITGEPGKSAYDIWLDAGNTGTVDDFLKDISAYGSWVRSGHEGESEADYVAYMATTTWGAMFNPD